MYSKFNIDPDIRKASTLPASFYRSHDVFEKIRENIFYRSWHFIGHESMVSLPGSVHPMMLLEGFMDEPLLLTRDENDRIHCLSNVCTHRANLLVTGNGRHKKLTCMYHGRRFGLNGDFEHMPEFKEAVNFPRECDDLHKFDMKLWGPFLFTSLDPSFGFDEILEVMNKRIGFLHLDEFKHEPSLSKEYLVNANWALYCDNYLEGFHVPFVHDSLNKVLDYSSYTTELYRYCNLQIGYSKDSSDIFDLPEGHPDHGKNVAAYYYWVFPNMMFNFYPWGLSINIVKPLAINRTKVSFVTYVMNPEKLERGAGQSLDKVEREDEFVVENVQKGMRSSFYKAGRFSPLREQGVHHFQRLLSEFLDA
jgi:choline monooxygenase